MPRRSSHWSPSIRLADCGPSHSEFELSVVSISIIELEPVMMPLLLSLDPATLPAPVATGMQQAQAFIESYGWFLLLGAIGLYTAYHYTTRYLQNRSHVQADPEHIETVTSQVRAARLAQQAAWIAAAPSLHRVTKDHSVEERTLQRKYGEKKHDQPADGEEKLQFEEVFGNMDEGFYKGRKDKKYRGDDSSSSSSSSSKPPPTSGFKPYTKPAPSGRNSRFGGGGGGGKKG